mmetsp:Transcript_50780/g.107753  ORF Transcript_50780/g.107753 Transcript_50780/m.107753 type:complete len:225 (-) Transcript_50780:8-682(-)
MFLLFFLVFRSSLPFQGECVGEPPVLPRVLYLVEGSKAYLDSSVFITLPRVRAPRVLSWAKARAWCSRTSASSAPLDQRERAEHASRLLKKPRTIPKPSGQKGSNKVSPARRKGSASAPLPAGGFKNTTPSLARLNFEKSKSCGPLSAHTRPSTSAPGAPPATASRPTCCSVGSPSLNWKLTTFRQKASRAALLTFSFANKGRCATSRRTPVAARHFFVGVMTK